MTTPAARGASYRAPLAGRGGEVARRLPAGTRTMVRRVLRRIGFDLVRFDSLESIEFRRTLFMRAQKIGVVFDVGANVGQYGTLLRRNGYAGRILSFEPHPAAFARLQAVTMNDSRWECFRLGLGNEDKEASLRVSARSQCSSFLRMTERLAETDPAFREVGRERVQILRLDSFLHGLPSAPPPAFMMKLDVQGYEREVLQGAALALKKTALLEIELSLVPLYEGQALYDEIIRYVGDMGFSLISLSPVYIDRRSGHLLQVDAIFVRTPPPRQSDRQP